MTIEELASLKEKDLLKNVSELRPTVGVIIPANTFHVVTYIRKMQNTVIIETVTVDAAQVKCAFTGALALQLLQKYENLGTRSVS